jgi:uncharacterized protein YegL
MGIFDGVEGIVRRQMVLFFVVDTSGSMAGTKIGAVNTAIRALLPELKEIGGSDVDLKIACLTFSCGCSWMHPSPVPAGNFQWNSLSADGETDFGAACKELSAKMSKDKFLAAPSASVAPAVILMSDGDPTDDYKKGLSELWENKWYKYAIKVAVAIGEDANTGVLKEFAGNSEAVTAVHTPEALRKWIRFVSITSAQIGSKSQPVQGGQAESKQEAMVDQMKGLQQSDPDFSRVSTAEDDWD